MLYYLSVRSASVISLEFAGILIEAETEVYRRSDIDRIARVSEFGLAERFQGLKTKIIVSSYVTTKLARVRAMTSQQKT
jgi:hypothetical protein